MAGSVCGHCLRGPGPVWCAAALHGNASSFATYRSHPISDTADSLAQHRLLIGACDWRYPQWSGGFYPDDLPEDWRLAYYGNEFPVVLVPADYRLDAAGSAALREGSDAALFFVIELKADSDAAERIDAARQLADQCVGLLVDAAGMAPAELAELLARCAPLPVSLRGMDELPVSDTRRVTRCWDGEGALPAPAALNLVRMDCARASPRGLRTIIEALLAREDSGINVLLLEGGPPDVEILRQAVMIRDLL